METIVVTRHPALVAYLLENGHIDEGVRVLAHVEHNGQIRGRRVFGVLPLHLAVWAAEVVEVALEIPQEMRGVELTLEHVRRFAGAVTRYIVRPADVVTEAGSLMLHAAEHWDLGCGSAEMVRKAEALIGRRRG